MAGFKISSKNVSRCRLDDPKWRWSNLKPLGFREHFGNFSLSRNGTMMGSPDSAFAQTNVTGDTHIIHFGEGIIYDEINQYIIM
jgi:hypothetical protein